MLVVAASALFVLPSIGFAAGVDGPADQGGMAAANGEFSLDPALAGPAVALGLEDTRSRVDRVTVALHLAEQAKAADDARMARAGREIDALAAEADAIAERTVQGAIKHFQVPAVETNIMESRDLNSSVRAEMMGNAALVADTETFDVYRSKQKDLDVARAIQELRRGRNAELGAEVDALAADLDTDLSRLSHLEERNLQQGALAVSVAKSTWSQNLGRKQGFYLMTCPVAGPHSFIDSWGFPRSGGRRHKGVDMLAPIGTPIVAPVTGRVEHFNNTVGGRSFRMWDEFGNYYYGTHLSGFAKQGEVVAGEVIGYVGDDGNAAGISHLHFEIHAGGRGRQINPFVDTASVCDGAQY